jgi:hypothetical protein
MEEMAAMELGDWRMHSGQQHFPKTTRFSQRAFRWNIKSCYIQHTSTKQMQTHYKREISFFLFFGTPETEGDRTNLRGFPKVEDSLGSKIRQMEDMSGL